MDNLGIMDVKTLNSVLREYNKKARANYPIFSAIKIQWCLDLHRNVKGKFLHGQYVTTASILNIMPNIEQNYTDTYAGIGAEDKDKKYYVTPVIFNSPENVIPFLS